MPRQPVNTPRKKKLGTNVFLLIAGAIAGVSVLLSGAVLGYEFYLKESLASKTAQMEQAQREIDIDRVEGFIRLKNRLSSVKQLLDEHIELTNFLDVLEQRTLKTVRFSSLTVSVSADRSAIIQMEGVARSFNALAAQSSELAAEKRIKRAIFSNIAVNEDDTVRFSLSATLDSRLITSAEILPGIPNATDGTSEETAPPASPNILSPEAPLRTSGTSTPGTSTPATSTQPAL